MFRYLNGSANGAVSVIWRGLLELTTTVMTLDETTTTACSACICNNCFNLIVLMDEMRTYFYAFIVRNNSKVSSSTVQSHILSFRIIKKYFGSKR